MIEHYGWSAALQDAFVPCASQGYLPARVTAQHRDRWGLVTARGEGVAQVSGRFAFDAVEGGFPVVGDWVAVDEAGATIHAVAPRTGVLKRRAAGTGGGQQVLAAHVDTTLLTMSLNEDLNPRRLERYLVAAKDGDVAAVIVLTKADLCADVDAALAGLAAVAGDTPLVAVCARVEGGLDPLAPFLSPGRTSVLLGSSGVGKSTLLNRLLGQEAMATAAIREGDAKGRHTTRHRELFRLPNGALLIDTPGLREFGMAAEGEALDSSFAELIALFEECRFGDCTHNGEPGCAVQAAIDSGALAQARWANYQTLQREQGLEQTRGDPQAQAAKRARWKKINKAQRAKVKLKDSQTDWD